MKIVIEREVFTEPEELLVCVGAIESVLIYSGRNSDDKLSYRIWWGSCMRNKGDGF